MTIKFGVIRTQYASACRRAGVKPLRVSMMDKENRFMAFTHPAEGWIKFSRRIDSMAELIAVIRHEVTHHVVFNRHGRMRHGRVFRKAFRELWGSKYGSLWKLKEI